MELTLDTIHNADCTSLIGEVCSKFPNCVVVTDPPFNVGYHYDVCKDSMTDDEYYGWLCDNSEKTGGGRGILTHCPSVVIHYPEKLYGIAMRLGRIPERVISWCYNSNTPRQHRDIAYFGIAPNLEGLGEYKNQNDRRVRKLMEEGRKPVGYDWLYCDQIKNVSREKTGHPCQMPLSVMLYVVSSLPKDAVIVEPFAGSGTTCLAAKRTGRHYVGFEISGNYCEAANRRLRDDSPLLDGAVLTE